MRQSKRRMRQCQMRKQRMKKILRSTKIRRMEILKHNSSNENGEEGGKTDSNAELGKESGNGKDDVDKSNKEKTNTEAEEAKHKSDLEMCGIGERKAEKGKKEDVDKELLQAFRFFDRNQVGYVRVEDMRLIIHNLGKFLSHRDVKELVQSALLESSTGRDDAFFIIS